MAPTPTSTQGAKLSDMLGKMTGMVPQAADDFHQLVIYIGELRTVLQVLAVLGVIALLLYAVYRLIDLSQRRTTSKREKLNNESYMFKPPNTYQEMHMNRSQDHVMNGTMSRTMHPLHVRCSSSSYPSTHAHDTTNYMQYEPTHVRVVNKTASDPLGQPHM